MSVAAKKILLKSSDGETFELDEVVALESPLFKHMMEDGCTDIDVSLPNISGKILSKIIVYCRKHAEADADEGKDEDRISSEDALKTWDADFANVDLDTLLDLMIAADYLSIKNLLDLTCQTVADRIQGKTSEDIRQIFNIRNDLTAKEDEEDLAGVLGPHLFN